jgi:hypothetical protein
MSDDGVDKSDSASGACGSEVCLNLSRAAALFLVLFMIHWNTILIRWDKKLWGWEVHPLTLLLMLRCAPYVFGLTLILSPRQISNDVGPMAGGRVSRQLTPLAVGEAGWMLLILTFGVSSVWG